MSHTHKKKLSERKHNKQSLRSEILKIFNDNPTRVFNYKQLSSRIDIKTVAMRQLINVVLAEMAQQGILEQVENGKFKLKLRIGKITGKIHIGHDGLGHVTSEQVAEPILILPKNLNHALDGDMVKVLQYARGKKGVAEGEVTEIVQRAKNSFVGIVSISKNFAFLVPDGKKIPFDVFIPSEHLKNAKDGDKAIVQISDWPKSAKNPIGEIIEVLGRPGEHETEMHAILAEFNLPYSFPEHIAKKADHISDIISDEECRSRRDFRGITTITIDPVDAKDFDDALSIRKLENGNWEVGVHIADVTHYVKPGDPIDKEALDRATSVYLVDRVVPMLPERLSNFICSLRPNEDKLCFSYVAELNENADIMSSWYGRTVIRSIRRFCYEEVFKIIESGEGELKDDIMVLNTLAQKLRKDRFAKGSIAFEKDEAKIEVDEKGVPLRIYFKQYTLANELVEEFMLLANKQVATFIGKPSDNTPGKTFVYRIHDRPDPHKLENFASFINRFGYKIQLSSSKKISDSINKLLVDIQGKKEHNVIESLAIRSMSKAEYSTSNIGHYGLAFKYYTHFTSPIRRYPDMMVHRLLDLYLKKGRSVDANTYEEMCVHSSEMERRAMQAEWASIKYKQVEFLMDKIGKVFDGIVAGVAEWGVYVEINENKCEGLVPMREMHDDFYVFDEKNYCLKGRRTNKVYQLGDEVKVKIARANLAKRQLDFVFV